MAAIVVFYPEPIMDIAARGKGLVLEHTSIDERLEKLDFAYLQLTAWDHIMSFISNPIPGFGRIIPEVVHSGLGLGYNQTTGRAINPEDGSPISNLKVILASRLDRALIEVSMRLKKEYPDILFSSCTRLADVYMVDSDDEFNANIHDRGLRERPTGELGIPTRLRAIHGGLYPKSDIVVADDILSEIAARTWIDEYAKLDRSQLLTMPYNQWIAQARDSKLEDAIHALSGKFTPNTVSSAEGGAPMSTSDVRSQDQMEAPGTGLQQKTDKRNWL